jgi:WASH complex subunit FAM21
LLLYLQEFSQKLTARTHAIEQMVDGLVHETKLTRARTHNVFNEFLMLANTQFIENVRLLHACMRVH